jgi:hypothetical protein
LSRCIGFNRISDERRQDSDTMYLAMYFAKVSLYAYFSLPFMSPF